LINQTVDIIKTHYRDQAERFSASPKLSMEDEIVRDKEVELILSFVTLMARAKPGPLNILDLGCGNGWTLDVLARRQPDHAYWGVDFTEELVSIAAARALPNCRFEPGDARALRFESGFFDAVYTERCLINILDWDEQQAALREIHRVLKPGGSYLMIECFTDGLHNNNRARRECGLSELKEAYHNKYFDKPAFLDAITGRFVIVDPSTLDPEGTVAPIHSNFLSSHYFVARVLHALVTRGEQTKNTEFVRFFSTLTSSLPPVGNYAPLQAHVLRKTTSDRPSS
jgi:ubiquinone/menaquinone biosynthesis C-methylase UbiE